MTHRTARGAGVCKACFSGEASRQGRAMAECRAAFVADLDPAAPGFPATLGALAARLKQWRALLQAACEDSLPASLRLQDESRVLQACPSLYSPWRRVGQGQHVLCRLNQPADTSAHVPFHALPLGSLPALLARKACCASFCGVLATSRSPLASLRKAALCQTTPLEKVK